MQSQQTKTHKATKYGVSTWCHFHVTIGSVVMVVEEALAGVSDSVLLLDDVWLLLLLLLLLLLRLQNRSPQHGATTINNMQKKTPSFGKSAMLERFQPRPASFSHLLVLSDLGSLLVCENLRLSSHTYFFLPRLALFFYFSNTHLSVCSMYISAMSIPCLGIAPPLAKQRLSNG